MLYVWSATWRPNITREASDAALMRRAQWQYPSGLKVHGEYWLTGTPTVILIFEADSIEPIMELGFTWGDVFETECKPAVTSDEGLRLGPEILARRPD
jgi:hypothetical protein